MGTDCDPSGSLPYLLVLWSMVRNPSGPPVSRYHLGDGSFSAQQWPCDSRCVHECVCVACTFVLLQFINPVSTYCSLYWVHPADINSLMMSWTAVCVSQPLVLHQQSVLVTGHCCLDIFGWWTILSSAVRRFKTQAPVYEQFWVHTHAQSTTKLAPLLCWDWPPPEIIPDSVGSWW